MKTILFLVTGLSVAACAPKKAANGNPDELAMLVGTYTNGTSKGIYTFRFNQETGAATPLNSVELPNPSYLTPSADGKMVYAVSEMNDSTAAVSSLAFDRETGALRLLNTELTYGADPCYVATNGNEVLTASASGGTVSVFPYARTALAPADTLFETAPPVPTLCARLRRTCIAPSSHRTASISLPPTSVPTAFCASSCIPMMPFPICPPRPLT